MNSDNDTPFGKGALSEGFYHSLARFRPTISPIDPNGHFTELTMIPYLQSGTYTNTQKNNLTLVSKHNQSRTGEYSSTIRTGKIMRIMRRST